jgi:hypothetical protein
MTTKEVQTLTEQIAGHLNTLAQLQIVTTKLMEQTRTLLAVMRKARQNAEDAPQ